jgi:hypothetical protein
MAYFISWISAAATALGFAMAGVGLFLPLYSIAQKVLVVGGLSLLVLGSLLFAVYVWVDEHFS